MCMELKIKNLDNTTQGVSVLYGTLVMGGGGHANHQQYTVQQRWARVIFLSTPSSAVEADLANVLHNLSF